MLAAVLLARVSMLTIFSQEALWTFAVSCAIVVGNTYSFIYTGLIVVPTLQCTRGGRTAQQERQQRPQRSGAQGGHLLGRLLLRRRRLGRSTWGGGPDRGAPTLSSPPPASASHGLAPRPQVQASLPLLPTPQVRRSWAAASAAARSLAEKIGRAHV